MLYYITSSSSFFGQLLLTSLCHAVLLPACVVEGPRCVPCGGYSRELVVQLSGLLDAQCNLHHSTSAVGAAWSFHCPFIVFGAYDDDERLGATTVIEQSIEAIESIEGNMATGMRISTTNASDASAHNAQPGPTTTAPHVPTSIHTTSGVQSVRMESTHGDGDVCEVCQASRIRCICQRLSLQDRRLNPSRTSPYGPQQLPTVLQCGS